MSNVTLVESKAEKKDKRPNTANLKAVPQVRAERDRIRVAAADFVKEVDRSKPLSRASLQAMGENLLRSLGQPEQFLGFTMVCLANEFWRDQVSAIDFKRRLLLLPHCLKHAEGCPADYDEFGLDCRKCGACSVADFKIKAEELGYKVLVSEGTPIVLKIIVSGHVDAIVGVACLNVLERALDKIILSGVPCVAVPLLSSNCRSTSVDEDWVTELIGLRTEPPKQKTRTYVHLMRAASRLFDEPELSRLAGRRSADRSPNPAPTPLETHEKIAFDWLSQGGKRSRPFIALAVYDAVKGATGTISEEQLVLPDALRRTALAIEAFHKASLVHDDIEDDDTFRYGRTTLHRQYGVPVAINAGDYLIGLGYRLLRRERAELGGDCAADVLNRLSEAHLKLSEGQGAELLWREATDKNLTPLDALKIYALKTAPAFEAALYCGLRVAGPTDSYDKMVPEFSKALGVAFQILNDLKDWEVDAENKVIAGQDVLSARPTLLLALALESLSAEDRSELLSLVRRDVDTTRRDDSDPCSLTIEKVRRLFERADVFTKAQRLVEKYRAKAEAVADDVEPVELRELLYYLVDTVLEQPCAEHSDSTEPATPQLLQIIPPQPAVS